MGKSINSIILAIFIALFSTQGMCDIVLDFEGAVLSGDYSAARKYTESMYREFVRTPRVSLIGQYESLVELFETETKFNASADKYLESKNQADYYTAQAEFSKLAMLSKRHSSYAVSVDFIQRLNEKMSAANKRFDLVREARHIAEQEQLEEQRRLREQREKEDAERQAKSQEEQRQYERDREREEREEQRQQAKLKADRAARMKQCGDDFGSPRIGMSLARAKECVGNFRLVSEVNRADGVVSTYRTGSMYIHVMGGRISAWGRY